MAAADPAAHPSATVDRPPPLDDAFDLAVL
jgi:hypothetical protein